LKSDNAKLLEKNNDLLDKYKRALAETENVRTRGVRLVEEAKMFSVQAFCKDLLDAADVLQRALDSVPVDKLKDEVSFKALYDGVHMTRDNLMKTFSKHGVKQTNPLGEQFDPNIHEAIMQSPPDEKYPKSNTISNVISIGYTLHDRPIRPAKVVVIR